MVPAASSIPPRPVLVASHERSGTHLLIDLLRRNFKPCRARPNPGHNPHDWLYLSIDRLGKEHPRPMTTSAADRVLARAQRPLLKSHALPGFGSIREDARAWLDTLLDQTTTLYVLRDGRAVMPSFHKHRLSIDPSTPREFSEFLRTPIGSRTPPQTWAHHANAWTAQEGTHVIRFEQIIAQPDDALNELGTILKLDPDSKVHPVLPPRGASPWAARRARFTGRLASSNLVERGERTLRWRELFTEKDLVFFTEQAGETLAKLGYTGGPDLVDKDCP